MEGISQEEEDKQEEETDELDGDGRRRRKRKVPKRYSFKTEAIQGIFTMIVIIHVFIIVWNDVDTWRRFRAKN